MKRKEFKHVLETSFCVVEVLLLALVPNNVPDVFNVYHAVKVGVQPSVALLECFFVERYSWVFLLKDLFRSKTQVCL